MSLLHSVPLPGFQACYVLRSGASTFARYERRFLSNGTSKQHTGQLTELLGESLGKNRPPANLVKGAPTRLGHGKRWLSNGAPKRALGEEADAVYPKLGEFGPAMIGSQSDGLTRYPGLTSSKGLLRSCDYFGTVVFAMSGSITAATCGMDVLGCSIIGTITAVGGGTVRDAIILHKQPFWVEEWEYIAMALGAGFLTFCAWPHLPGGNMVKDENGGEGEAMWLGDAIGVGTFAAVGAMNGLRMCVHPLIAIICGGVTATFGGLTRDVLCGLPRQKQGHGRILHSVSDIYLSTALGGAAAYVFARNVFHLPLSARILACMGTSIGLRYAAKEYDLGLPTWDKPDFHTEKRKEQQ